MLPGMPKISAKPTEYTHWRVRITASQTGSSTGVAEIEFRATVGGADLTDSASFTAIENGHYLSNSSDRAFDNSLATYWFNTGQDNWVGAAFDTAPAAVLQIAIKSSDGGMSNNHMPKDFVVEKGDGAAWETVKTVTGEASWSSSETRTYNL